MDVVIVCHTEFGRVHKRRVAATRDVEGVSVGIGRLLSIAEKYGAKVTLAICPEVASSVPAGKYEVGLHIHPGHEWFSRDGLRWFVGDTYLREHCRQSGNGSTALRDYSYEEQLGMINTGKQKLEEVFGKTPTSFLAGRWSVGNLTMRALTKAGFTHDCSSMPHHSAAHFDWSRLPRACKPYHPDPDDYQSEGDSPLLVIPAAQLAKGGCVNPEVAVTYGVSWLKLCFIEYRLRKMPLFHICLHSPAMLDEYLSRTLDNLLRFIAGHRDVIFKYVSEIEGKQ